ncbi:MAG: glycine--tRNA ligase subunit beta [Campylobacterales bacterium]|nr:glycine--tRNA ligase subunit beta [Campylobacterales bacterium]
MVKPLLIEIGVEELPAVPLLKELNEIEKKWANVLEKNGLLCEFEFYYTPRRLVLWHREFKTHQEDRTEEFYGAPVEMAIKDGIPTPAALGFAKKCGVDFDQVSHAQKGGKEVLYYSKNIVGKESGALLDEMINQWIKTLSFGKSMRWGSNTESFIRPIRWVNVMLGEEQVETELFGVQSAPSTYVHRISHFGAMPLSSIHDYFDVLKNGSVTLFPQERRENILKAFASLEEEHGIFIDIDEDLLDEVVAITEHPTPLLGKFDESFLELPPEVIITSMREHQRYFPVFKEGKLINAFVVVSNALADDFTHVIEGNERVLRPRLSDALFFYHNDLKKGLSTQGLEKVVFMKGLGTLQEKIEREKKIVTYIQHYCYVGGIELDKELLTETIQNAKADLMSEMVYEFTELQGIMGAYYALAEGKSKEIALAIKEQYYFNGDEISTPFSAVVNIAIKLDTLIGMFSIGEIPTGSRDPFALRRAVNGIISIALKHQIPLDLSVFFRDEKVRQLYSKNDYIKNLELFVIERLAGVYPSINNSIIQAVVNRENQPLLDLQAFDIKVKQVDEMAKSSDAKESFSLIKRLANILKDETIAGMPDGDLFNEHERKLFDKFSEIMTTSVTGPNLEMLFEIKKTLDDFFINVMVNDENETLRTNRKQLLDLIYSEFDKFADFKQITL